MLKEQQKIKQRQAVFEAIKTKGYLHKKSRSLWSRFQKRYFIIDPHHNQLVYYTDDTLTEQRNRVSLLDIENIKRVSGLQFSFFYKVKQYFFKAQSRKENDQWIDNLTIVTQYLKGLKRELRADQYQQITLVKHSSTLSEFEANVKNTFVALNLKKLYNEFSEDFIKNRIAGHLCTHYFIFIISCKSLVTPSRDQIILGKEYILPFDFNVLYHFNLKTKTTTEIVKAEDITQIVLTDKKLKVNSFTTNLILDEKEFIDNFIEKLKRSVSIGAEYRNKQGIELKQNIDSLVELFLKQQNNRLKKQHIIMKLEDEYIGILNHQQFKKKQFKKNYSNFRQLIEYLITQMENTLNAIKLKKQDLRQLTSIYVNFYEQKVFKIWRVFWADNYESMNIRELISMTNLSHRYFQILSPYLNDRTRSITGIKIMRDIYLKKILSQMIQSNLKEAIKNVQLRKQKEIIKSSIPQQFFDSLRKAFKILKQNCDYLDLIMQSQRLLLEAAAIVLITQEESKLNFQNYQQQLLIALSNDVWDYISLIKNQFPIIDEEEITHSLMKFLKSTTKKLFLGMYNKQIVNQVQTPLSKASFLDINLLLHIRVCHEKVNNLENFHEKTKEQLMERVVEDINIHYLHAVISDLSNYQKTNQTILQVADKIRNDLKGINSLDGFEKQKQRLEILLECLQRLIGQDCDDDRIKQIYTQLKYNVFGNDFKHNDFKSLMKFKQDTFDEFESKVSFLDSVQMQTFDDKYLSEVQTDLDSSNSLISIRPRRETRQRTEAELLMNKDTDFEGYMQIKRVSSEKSIRIEDFRLTQTSEQEFKKWNYNSEYFKLSEGCLMWYNNPNSKMLVGRIFVSEIQQILQKTQGQFEIELKNQLKYKFKTCVATTSLKWVQQLNHSMSQPFVSQSLTKNISEQQVLTNLFQQTSKGWAKDRSSMLSNFRNHEGSKLVEEEPTLIPIKKKIELKKKKKFSFGSLFGCVSQQ